MKLNRWMLTACVAGVVSAVSTVALGGDVPPPWTPNPSNPETFQLWTFTNLSNPYQPDQVNNPNGTPQILPPGGTFLPNNPFAPVTGSGVIALDGTAPLRVLIPNYNQLFRKEIWVTLKFSVPPAGVGVPVITDLVGLDGTVGFQKNTPTILPIGPGVSEVSYLWSMATCWTFIMDINFPIGIPGSIGVIEQISVHTRCIIPAPSTAGLIALGGLVASRRRRRGG